MAKSNGKTVAITGATGFLGSELVSYLHAKGWNVIGLVRNPPENTEYASYRSYDITKPVESSALRGVDYVIHTAYVKHGRQTPNAYDINIEGAEDLVGVCKRQSVRNAIFISSMSAHKNAISEYGKQKSAIENIFLSAGYVALRPGLILGNGGLVKSMAIFMKSKHVVPIIDGGKQPLQTIAVYDLVRCIEKSLTDDISGVLTVATPTTYTYREFYKALARKLNTRVVFIHIPYRLLMLVFRILSLFRVSVEIGEDNLKGLRKLQSTNTSKDLKTLGIKLDDMETSLKNTHLTWYNSPK